MVSLEAITTLGGLFGLWGAGSGLAVSTVVPPLQFYPEFKDKCKDTKTAIKYTFETCREFWKVKVKDFYNLNKMSDEEFRNKYPKLNKYLDILNA